ncbi:MAG TPA: restriction endonuclease subunit S [Candidatus Contendobacter sp.]|nr:restriction endonuclease subunit S [Candidatus Contendobacter sp.]
MGRAMKKGWRTVALGDLCDILDSKRKPITKRDRKSGEYPYYGATGIQDFVEGFLFDEPLVLVGEDGAKWASGENTAFAIEGKCWVNNHAHVLRPNRALLNDNWLIHFLVYSDLSPFVSGLTVPKLNQGNLREIPIPLPPLPEQHRIVAILDEAFDGIATAKANAEKNLQNARALFESHLQSVFTERGEGWVDRQLASLCLEITVGHVGPMKKEYKENGVPFLRSQNIRPFEVSMDNAMFIDDTFHRVLKKSQLRPGDLAIVRTGYPGTAAVIPPELPDSNCSDLVIVRPGKEINPHFLAAFFNSAFGKQLVLGKIVGAAQKHFNITAAKEVMLHVPPMEVQHSIIEKADSLREETQRLESLYQQKLTALDDLKKSLLHQAFSGKL